MGFMAGFGPSFSRSFENQMERRSQEKQDAFRFTFQEYLDRSKQYDADKKADGQASRKAIALVEGSKAPKEAFPKVVEWIKSGLDDSEIEKRLKTGKFNISKPVAETPKTDTAAEAPTMDNQMAETGMAAPAAPTAPEGISEAPVGTAQSGNPITNVLGKLSKGPPSREEIAQKRRDEAMGKVAGSTGQSVEEVQARMRPYEAPAVDTSGVQYVPGAASEEAILDLPNAKFNYEKAVREGDQAGAAKYNAMIKAHVFAKDMKKNELSGSSGDVFIITDPETGQKMHVVGRQTENGIEDQDGKVYPSNLPFRSLTKGEEELWGKLGVGSESITKYQKKQSDLAAGMQLTREMLDISKANRNALNAGGAISELVANTVRNVDGILSTIGQMGVTPDTMAQVDAMEKTITDQLLNGTIKNASEARAAIDAKLKLAGYRFGKLEGQDGRDLSNFDVSRLAEIVQPNNDPVMFEQNMRSYLAAKVDEINAEGRGFNEFNPTIQALKSQYGYSPVDGIVPTFDEYVADIPANEAYKSLQLDQKMPVPGTSPAPTAPDEAPVQYEPGAVQTGRGGIKYQFKGGDWKDRNNWIEVK